jgi:hypothetical protein
VQLTLPGETTANDNGLGAFLGDATTAPAQGPGPVRAGDVREQAGRRAKRLGEDLERWVAGYLSTAQRVGAVAWWMKVHPGVAHRRALIEGRWGFKLVWGERAAADFVGLLPDGRMLAIECKSVEGHRLALSAIQPQQRTHLGAVTAAGGVGLLVAEFRDEGAVTRTARQYVIPWHLAPWATARTAEALTELAATPWRERRGEFLTRLRGE